MKKYILSLSLALALMLTFGSVTSLLADGGGCSASKSSCGPCPASASCTPSKSGDCGPCPAASACGSKAQKANATANAGASCQGNPANCSCPDKGKCDGKCTPGDCKGKCKASDAKAQKTGTAATKAKTTKAVEVKTQTVSAPAVKG